MSVELVAHNIYRLKTACPNCDSRDIVWAHQMDSNVEPDEFNSPICIKCTERYGRTVHGAETLADYGTNPPRRHVCGRREADSAAGVGLIDTAEQSGDAESELGALDKGGAKEASGDSNDGQGNAPKPSDMPGAKKQGQASQQAQGQSEGQGEAQDGQGDAANGEGLPQSSNPGESKNGAAPNEPDDDDPFVRHSEQQQMAMGLLELISGVDSDSRKRDESLKQAQEDADINNFNVLSDRIKAAVVDFQKQLAEIERPTRIEVKIAQTGEVKQVAGLSHKVLADLILVLSAGEHALLIGPAGTGKGRMAEQAAEVLRDGRYGSLPLSPQTPASLITGYMDANGNYVRTLYREIYENGGVFHFDEFDNAHPAVLAIVNDSLAATAMAFPDGMVQRHEDFLCVASANTFGRGPDRTYAARQRGDAATWDRFTILACDYDAGLEKHVCQQTGASDKIVDAVLRYVRGIRKNVERKELPVVVGQRATMGMCRLLNAGMDVDKAIEARCRRGVSDQDWARMTEGVAKLSL